jgi:hypothetical protein
MTKPVMTKQVLPNQASLVLAADNSLSLAAFYGTLLGCQPQAGFSASHWRLPWRPDCPAWPPRRPRQPHPPRTPLLGRRWPRRLR